MGIITINQQDFTKSKRLIANNSSFMRLKINYEAQKYYQSNGLDWYRI